MCTTPTGGDATVTITSLPDPGSSALTSIQYRIDAGAWTQLTASPAVGTFPLNNQFTDGVAVDVTIRAVNSTESGPAAVPISVTTSSHPSPRLPSLLRPADSLDTRTLTVTTGTVTGNPTPSLSIAMTLDGSAPTPAACCQQGPVRGPTRCRRASAARRSHGQSQRPTAKGLRRLHGVRNGVAADVGAVHRY
jgi:hypothetical protein